MFRFVGLCFGMLGRLFRGRRSLLLENLALRQQLALLKRRHPRPSLSLFDKLFWVVARRVWSAWKESLILVTLESVRPLAPDWVSYVLAANFRSPEASGKETDAQGGSGIDLPFGRCHWYRAGLDAPWPRPVDGRCSASSIRYRAGGRIRRSSQKRAALPRGSGRTEPPRKLSSSASARTSTLGGRWAEPCDRHRVGRCGTRTKSDRRARPGRNAHAHIYWEPLSRRVLPKGARRRSAVLRVFVSHAMFLSVCGRSE
jgi:hypothetical protein